MEYCKLGRLQHDRNRVAEDRGDRITNSQRTAPLSNGRASDLHDGTVARDHREDRVHRQKRCKDPEENAELQWLLERTPAGRFSNYRFPARSVIGV